MKINMCSRVLHAMIAVGALVSGSSNVLAQDAPVMETFVTGGNSVVAAGPNVSSVVADDFVVAPDLPTSPGVDSDSDLNATDDYFDEEYRNAVQASSGRTMVLGISVPIFDRELDGDRLFSFNPADPTQSLNSSSADPNGTSGIDINFARRNSSGWGFEARYWGLYASADTGLLGGSPTTAISGLGQITDSGVLLSDTFNTSDFHSLTRDYSFNNVELNLLRNGRTFAPLGRGLTVERVHGFRYVQFDESLEYAAISSSNSVVRSALNSSVQNSLFGVQTGARAEWQLFSRLSLTVGGKLGLFNNRARTNLVATNQQADLSFSRPAISGGVNAGDDFEFGDSKDDLSLLGEFDLGLTFLLSQRSRFRAGYRVLGVSDIADAEQNIPSDFTNVTALQSSDTDGDLVLEGGYFGLEISF